MTRAGERSSPSAPRPLRSTPIRGSSAREPTSWRSTGKRLPLRRSRETGAPSRCRPVRLSMRARKRRGGTTMPRRKRCGCGFRSRRPSRPASRCSGVAWLDGELCSRPPPRLLIHSGWRWSMARSTAPQIGSARSLGVPLMTSARWLWKRCSLPSRGVSSAGGEGFRARARGRRYGGSLSSAAPPAPPKRPESFEARRPARRGPRRQYRLSRSWDT
jgi:hypothetical protein